MTLIVASLLTEREQRRARGSVGELVVPDVAPTVVERRAPAQRPSTAPQR